jgi:hypothetical protein
MIRLLSALSSTSSTDFTLTPTYLQRIMSKAQLYKSNQHINRTWKLKEKAGWLSVNESEAAKSDSSDFPEDFPKDLQKFPEGFGNDD